MNNIGGDDITKLPIKRDSKPEPADLEFIHSLFQPTHKNFKSNASPFKTALFAGILFFIFSLPFVNKIASSYMKGNQIYSILLLTVIFIIVFFIIQKLMLKKK
jgi:hypothetical protein